MRKRKTYTTTCFSYTLYYNWCYSCHTTSDGLDGLAFGQMPEGPRPLVGRPITVRPLRRNAAPHYLLAHYQASIVLKSLKLAFDSKSLFMPHNMKLISIYARYESLYTTVLVALNIYIGLHYFVALFNQMFKKCIV